MLLTHECGISIPELCTLSIRGKDILLVKRFDRQKTASGYTRVGFLSALSLMQMNEIVVNGVTLR